MKTLRLLVLLSGISALGAMNYGPITAQIQPGSYLNVTNDTTNVYSLASFAFSWTNYVPTTGTADIWWVRSAFSNKLVNAVFTNVRCVSGYVPQGQTLGRNDGYRVYNGTTNVMNTLLNIGQP